MPAYHAPEWILPVFITAVALGFPVALVLGWAFELKGGVWLLAAMGLIISMLAVGGY